jgi:hypothetical protein
VVNASACIEGCCLGPEDVCGGVECCAPAGDLCFDNEECCSGVCTEDGCL